MSTKDTFENMARNTWLAGLGSIESSLELLGKSIDIAQEKSNSLYSELLTRGEEIQNKLNETKEDMETRGKKLFGLGSQELHEKKLAELNATVDHLTTVVVKLIEKRNAVPAPSRSAPKTAVKATPKARANVTVKAKPAETAKKSPAKAKPKVAVGKKTVAKESIKPSTAQAPPKNAP